MTARRTKWSRWATLLADVTAEAQRERRRADHADAQVLRLAQGLRVIRDTTSATSAYGQIAARALIEAGVPDPPEDDCRP